MLLFKVFFMLKCIKMILKKKNKLILSLAYQNNPKHRKNYFFENTGQPTFPNAL
jgi:hypothetical protein